MSEKLKYSAEEIVEIIKGARKEGVVRIEIDGLGAMELETEDSEQEQEREREPERERPRKRRSKNPACPECDEETRPGYYGGFYCYNCQGRDNRRGGGGGGRGRGRY